MFSVAVPTAYLSLNLTQTKANMRARGVDIFHQPYYVVVSCVCVDCLPSHCSHILYDGNILADDSIIQPDGYKDDMRFVFCGEHASDIHGWIQVSA